MTDSERIVYRGKIVELRVERVALPNGVAAEFEIVRHPGGAAAVALNDRDEVCLLRQYRHAFHAWLWELPAGKLDAGESPIVAARRELEEEAGVRAQTWEPLGTVISSPGVFTEVVHLFRARDLTAVGARAEAHELFEVHWVPWVEALRRARAGEIVDAKTLAGLLRASAPRR